MNNIDFIRSNVCLSSYSSSRNFAGYSSFENGYGAADYEKLLLQVASIFLYPYQIVSSLNIGIDLDEHVGQYSVSSEGLRCRDGLIAAGIIRNDLSDPHVDDFHFNDSVDEGAALSLIRFQTTIGGAQGHAFFVDSESEVAIYPHDDCGLGFIIGGNPHVKAKKLNVLKQFWLDNTGTGLFI